MRALDELAMRGNQVVRARHRCVAADADVVDALEDDDVLRAWLDQDVAIETRQRADAGTVAQDAVAGDAFVQHGHRNLRRRKTPRKFIGPAVVRVHGRARSVGDRVAEGDDGRCRRRRIHFDAREEEPCARRRRASEVSLTCMIAFGRDVIRLVRALMRRQRRRRGGGVARQVDVDRQIGGGGNGEAHRVADGHGAGGDHRRRTAAEGDGAIRLRLNGGVFLAKRDVDSADFERDGAERIAQDEAYAIAAERCVDDLAQRLILEVQRRRWRLAVPASCAGPGTKRRGLARIRLAGCRQRHLHSGGRRLWTRDDGRGPGAYPVFRGARHSDRKEQKRQQRNLLHKGPSLDEWLAVLTITRSITKNTKLYEAHEENAQHTE